MRSSSRPGVFYPAAIGVAAPSAWSPEDLGGAVSFAAFGATDFGAAAAPAHPASVPWAEVERMVAEAAQAGAAAAAEQLQAELERLELAAYERGREEGRIEGELAERARLRHAVAAAEDALDELRAGDTQWAGVIEENVCALATAVARQLLGRELRGDAQTVADLVRRALAEVPIDQPIAIRVNPQDLALLSTAIGEDGMPIAVAPGRDARWVADAKIAPGGCLVEGRDRIVDGRVDTALERVYRRLTYTNA